MRGIKISYVIQELGFDVWMFAFRGV